MQFSSLLPAYATRERFNLPLFSAYVLMHLSLLVAPFTFSWEGLIAFVVLYTLTICFGITTGYHRLLAHNSFKTSKVFRFILAFLGVLALQRGPIWWVAAHRLHHKSTDLEFDPHSPTVSFIWSHMLWPFFRHPQLDENIETAHSYSKDLCKDPGLCFLEKHYSSINQGSLLVLFGLGYWMGGVDMGISLLVWGGILRWTLALHATWLVNSATHVWGYRNFNTTDQSRNTWWVALLTFGEGWHNNHHASQKDPRIGRRWFEVDVAYCCIVVMHYLGLVQLNLDKKVQPKAMAVPT